VLVALRVAVRGVARVALRALRRRRRLLALAVGLATRGSLSGARRLRLRRRLPARRLGGALRLLDGALRCARDVQVGARARQRGGVVRVQLPNK